MPLPATHLQSVQATVKMVNASELSLRGPEGAVAMTNLGATAVDEGNQKFVTAKGAH